MSTYADAMASITTWLKEPVGDPLMLDALSDAASDLWEAEIQVILSNFIGGPITLNIAQGSERVPIVLITDPTVAPGGATIPGGNLGARALTWGYTFVTDGGSETLLSPTQNINAGANTLLQVPSPPLVANAVGWNIYVQLAANPPQQSLLIRQNQDPLPFQDNLNVPYSWTEPLTGVAVAPGVLPPTANGTADSIAYISHLEQQLPDTTWRPWDEGEIDSVFMRRLSRTIASATPYQYYAYDFVNNSRLEIRPATGAALSPRYFFIQRPPRALTKTATIPFPSQGEYAFMRYRAMSLLLLGDHEYSAREAWGEEAGAKLESILLSLNKQNKKRNNTIRPFLYS